MLVCRIKDDKWAGLYKIAIKTTFTGVSSYLEIFVGTICSCYSEGLSRRISMLSNTLNANYINKISKRKSENTIKTAYIKTYCPMKCTL